MGGLAKVLKIYGTIKVKDATGREAIWLWDYKNDKARLKSEMSHDEIMASEKAKWQDIKKHLGASLPSLDTNLINKNKEG